VSLVTFVRFALAFFLGFMLFKLARAVGLRLRRQSGRPVYKQLLTAIGLMMWIGVFLLFFA